MTKPPAPWDELEDGDYVCNACGAFEGYRTHNPGCKYMDAFLNSRIYNGLDTRKGWPVITNAVTPTPKPSPKKKWWRRLLGL